MFKFEEHLNERPSYDVAPTHDMPIMRRNTEADGRELSKRWSAAPDCEAEVGEVMLAQLRQLSAEKKAPDVFHILPNLDKLGSSFLGISTNPSKKLARLDGESSNSPFETLEDWNTNLNGVKSELQSCH